MYTILVRQPAGIGDIFFCQKLVNEIAQAARDIHKEEVRIIWPVKPEFEYVKDYLLNTRCFPTSYVSTLSDFPYKELYNSPQKTIHYDVEEKLVFLPLHGHDLLDASVMKSKYRFAGVDWEGWNDDFAFVRNKRKEKELFYDYLQLKDDEPFVFLNQWFASPPEVLYKPFDLQCGNMRKVELKILPEFTIFDWSLVLEKAEHIVTVETSLNYLIESLNIRATKLVMLSKWNPPDFQHIRGLFNRPWQYIQ